MMNLFQEHEKHLLEVRPITLTKNKNVIIQYRLIRDHLLTLILGKTPVDSSVFSTISSKLVLSMDILNITGFGR